MNLQSEGGIAIETNTSSCAIRHALNDECLTEQHVTPVLSLDERGMILDCSQSFEKLFGFEWRDLIWHHVSWIFPQLTGVELIQAGQFNPLLNYLCGCGHLFQVQNRQGNSFSSNLSFVHIEHDGRRSLSLMVQPVADAKP
jgi:hypothetical protein